MSKQFEIIVDRTDQIHQTPWTSLTDEEIKSFYEFYEFYENEDAFTAVARKIERFVKERNFF